VGLWAPPNGGKTISCVAFNHELPTRLTRRTGVAARSLYSRGAFPTVRNDGALPVKTDPGHHHTTRFTLKHRDWDVPRRIELTDMSGEYYEDLLGDAKGDKVRLRRSMMLQTREAMFLIDPETCAGLGAAIDKSLEEPLRNLFSTYSKSALLAGLGQDDLRELLLHQKQILQGARYPPGGESNGNYKSLAARLSDAALQFVTPRTGVSLSDAHLGAQVQTIDEHLTFIAQLERPSGHTQLNDLAGFLETWGCPRHADGRLDIRLALVVSKSDMLTCDLPDDGEILADVDATSPWSAWSRRLEALSHASRLVLEEFESKLVETADSSFRTVGFFFMSSLGRPVDYTISGTSDIRTIAGADASGARTLSPRGVMWPLLWLAGDDAR
jgi:hypothetical protein